MKVDVSQIGAIKPTLYHNELWVCDCGAYTLAMRISGYDPPKHCGKPMKSKTIVDFAREKRSGQSKFRQTNQIA